MLLLMLFLPFLDKNWLFPKFFLFTGRADYLVGIKALLLVTLCLLTLFGYKQIEILPILFLVALPEEWFFRAYFQPGLSKVVAAYSSTKYSNAKVQLPAAFSAHAANIATSVFFMLLHVPAQGLRGLLVFFPSLLFGYVYQKTNDLILVVLLHAVSNVIYLGFLYRFF